MPDAAPRTGITFHHPVAFWAGTAAIVAGVLLHLPPFFAASEMGYRMEGMPMGGGMLVGMALILGGFGLAAYGLWPRGGVAGRGGAHARLHLHAMDDAELSGAHWGLLFVLGVALIVDVMKPATLGFVVPGTRVEYGISTRYVALLPMVALSGTTVGSLLWGTLADRIGRRAAILLAALMFMGTSICGFMPSFGWNLFMCFIMGTSAGGMLPIVYALMAETVPAKKRGWLVVLHAGMGTVGGYLLASGQAALLEPVFSWRILWFAGLPTGLLVLVLNHWIPESPRFLLEHGRMREAKAVMARFGIMVDEGLDAAPEAAALEAPVLLPETGSRLRRLFRPPLLSQSLTIALYGVAWGLVNWGFLTFVPTVLQDRGIAVGAASKVLFLSALLAVPGTVLVAVLYGGWSSRKTMILFVAVTLAALVGFAVADPGSGGVGGPWLLPLTILLLVGSGGMIAMLSPYAAEVYPTSLRGTGSGFAAGSSKFGGIVGPLVASALVAASPGFAVLAPAVAVPLAVTGILLAVTAVETRGRALEEVAEARGAAAPNVPAA